MWEYIDRVAPPPRLSFRTHRRRRFMMKKSSRPRVDLRIVVDEAPDVAESVPLLAEGGTNDNDGAEDAWWLYGYCLPPPGHLGAHSVPVTASKDRRLDVFTSPTQEAIPTPARSCFGHVGDGDASIDTTADAVQTNVSFADPFVPKLASLDRRRGAVLLPSLSSLISISPPTVKRSSADASLDYLHEASRHVKQFKLM
ncbi:hypothetical protein H310_07305 [Aphanomyces invadans]|uniref:Uncharacterized protein n=1 Tax=Aphanomyces invadans TaxID=157072 RepID=A0A024U3C8_9STRA|nr:hypothetical protein H310_07305 [Aphanomyces invadans]ETW00764.1 hypothetical protein H310_07305 [Aphanomyces invadans]|eukprot:XP_008870899.1 hypothetical protein H310_07305 [Aphanomyces invadans]